MRRNRLHAGFQRPSLFVAGLGILVTVPMSSSWLPEAVFDLLPLELKFSFSHAIRAGYKEKVHRMRSDLCQKYTQRGNDGPGVFSKTVEGGREL